MVLLFCLLFLSHFNINFKHIFILFVIREKQKNKNNNMTLTTILYGSNAICGSDGGGVVMAIIVKDMAVSR